MKKIVKLTDGSELETGLTGEPGNKVVMLPIAKKNVVGQEAEQLQWWGVDPELGSKFVEGLSDRYQALHFDYEGHLFAHPRPELLTPEAIAMDFLRIADEWEIGTFSYYGYSWLALAGLQLAIRTNRLESLIMGGFPPYGGPYPEMLTVTAKTYEQALRRPNPTDRSSFHGKTDPGEFDWEQAEVGMDPNQTKQFFTLYRSLTDFDDTTVHDGLRFPKLTFAGEKDTIVYGPNFGNVTVDIAGSLKKNEEALRRLGWDVRILYGDDMDHTKAMQPAAALPLIKLWLMDHLG